MAYPSITCLNIGGSAPMYGQPEDPFQPFNMLYLKHSSGVVLATYDCEPSSSTFLPAPTNNPLTSSDLATLWPSIIGLLVAGFIVQRIVKAF